jgi:hypothetical protein
MLGACSGAYFCQSRSFFAVDYSRNLAKAGALIWSLITPSEALFGQAQDSAHNFARARRTPNLFAV